MTKSAFLIIRNPDMRRFLKKVKNDLIYLSVRIFLAIFSLLPLCLTGRILKFLALSASFLPIKENRIALKNLSMFYDRKKSREILQKMYSHYADSIAEVIAVVFKKRELHTIAQISEESKRVLEEALGEKKGIIYFTAHLGNWELMAMTLAADEYRTNTIAKESYDPRFTKLIRYFRETNGVRCIFRKEEGILEKITDVIKSNQIMGFLIDQNTRVPSLNITFLGREAPTPLLPVKILKETGAALVVGYNHRIDGKIQTEIKRIIYSADEDERDILEKVNKVLSEEILKYPHEWIWIHDRWNIFC
ncbi:MAG: lysophospholipid acyltransferase family protein [Deltaproteobacteria bacterium]|nr:lysophospholipid acyltransferase family protein [Deltaproteobacteria bacterium]